MTLTRDRRTELLAAAPLFAGVDAAGLDAIAERTVEVDVHRRPRHRPPGRGRHRASSSSPRAASRVVRDGADDRDARPRRLLRGAVGARRPAADRPGRRRRADHLPRARDLGLRGRRHRAAVGRPGAPARAGRAAADADRSRPALTARRSATPRCPPGPAAADRDRHLPVHRHRGLDPPRARARHRAVPRHPRAPPRAAAGGVRGARRPRAEHRGRLVLRDLPATRSTRSRPPPTRSGRSPPRPWPDGVDVRVRMGLHTGEHRVDRRRRHRLRHQPDGADRRGRPRRPGPRSATRPGRSSTDALPDGVTSARPRASIGSRTCARPSAWPSSSSTACPDDFPPLRSLDARPNNLPTQLTTFVGRERELGRGRRAARPAPGC